MRANRRHTLEHFIIDIKADCFPCVRRSLRRSETTLRERREIETDWLQLKVSRLNEILDMSIVQLEGIHGRCKDVHRMTSLCHLSYWQTLMISIDTFQFPKWNVLFMVIFDQYWKQSNQWLRNENRWNIRRTLWSANDAWRKKNKDHIFHSGKMSERVFLFIILIVL